MRGYGVWSSEGIWVVRVGGVRSGKWECHIGMTLYTNIKIFLD